jgi:LemA protein
MLLLLLAIVGGLVATLVAVVVIYNGLVALRVQANNAWADIDVQLKRRHDLVPNLVETVKGYAGHEKEALEAVVAARAKAMGGGTPAARGEAETALGHAIKSLFALAEAYPQLRAVESFARLQGRLDEIETALQHARRYYNAVVRDLNTRIEQFPSNLVANQFAFTPREFFELREPAERATPKVVFKTGT